MGFLWADLGSWCLDRASDFPARNVHSPRETANHRQGGERKKEGETDTERERKEKEKGNRGKDRENKKVGGSSGKKRNVCGGSVGGQSESGNCKREEAEAWLV